MLTNGEKCIKIDNHVKIVIERNTDIDCPYHRCDVICESDEMQDIKANLILATNYLIQLFFKTNKRYVCTRTKIGKLLSIVAFAFAKEGKRLFNEDIYLYNDCGTTIKELWYIIENEVYTVSADNSKQKVIDEKEINEKTDAPARYSNSTDLSDEVKEIIKEVFLHFGAYKPWDLGQLQNEFLACQKIKTEDGRVELEAISEISKCDFAKSNVLIDFLLDNH